MKELGKEPDDLLLGQKDAVHVPIVIARSQDYKQQLHPGDWVNFTDKKYTQFVVVDTKEEALGMIDPFLDEVSPYDNVVILLKPGITSPVRHEFEINPELLEETNKLLREELKELQEKDSGCSECWTIRNGSIIRY